MRLRRRSSRSDDEDDDLDAGEDQEEDGDDEEEDEEPRPRRRKRPIPRHPRGRPPPPRRWRGPDDTEEDDEDSDRSAWAGPGKKGRPPVFWRARDSLYFEPLVALAIVIVLLVSLFAYTGNWPPAYVIESNSMEHGPNDVLGLINAGDLVLAQKVPNSTIVPYVVGLRSGYSTYGEYGDVLLYYPNGQTGSTPIIHRAIVYFQWNGNGAYSAPELNGLPCGTAAGAVYSPCGSTNIPDGSTLTFYHIGWMSRTYQVPVNPTTFGDHSGYLTLGDNNTLTDQDWQLSTLVEPGWVIGVARGMIPWFGSFKLLVEGNAGLVPAQSWEFLGLSIAGVILLAFGIHYALRFEGVETPLRKKEEDEARAEREAEEGEEEEEPEPRERGWLRSLRPWRRPEEYDEEDEITPGRRPATGSRRSPERSSRRGRPRPRVRRNERTGRRSRDSEL